jgi:hypothetical protein
VAKPLAIQALSLSTKRDIFYQVTQRFPTLIVRPPSSVNETVPTKPRSIVEAGLFFLLASVASHLSVRPSLAPEHYLSKLFKVRLVGTAYNKNLVQGTDSDAVAGPINSTDFVITSIVYIAIMADGR